MPHALPCFKPDDLYSYHARKTIARLIPEFLARNKITVTELSHRADMLEKLEATGMLLQHAIQKIAVAQAASTTTPVQQIVKSLNALTTKAFHRVYRDSRKGVFPEVEPESFGALGRRTGRTAGRALRAQRRDRALSATTAGELGRENLAPHCLDGRSAGRRSRAGPASAFGDRHDHCRNPRRLGRACTS